MITLAQNLICFWEKFLEERRVDLRFGDMVYFLGKSICSALGEMEISKLSVALRGSPSI